MQVDWWSKNPREKEAVLKAFRDANPNLNLPTDEYAAVIMCTADPKKMDGEDPQQVVTGVAVRGGI